MYDLQEDDAFVKVSQYQDKENIYTGEVGRLFGVRLVETTEAKVFEGAGASGADVASVIVLGQYAYGVTSLKGAKPRVIVKPAGSAGTADPLDQISTVGWKMDGFGAVSYTHLDVYKRQAPARRRKGRGRGHRPLHGTEGSGEAARLHDERDDAGCADGGNLR